MKRVKPIRTLTALAVTTALSGCGLISNIIGEQTIDDPFGIDNQRVAVVMAEESAAGLAVQAKGQEGTTFTFADEDFSLRGFGGDYIKSEVGLEPTVTVSKPTGGYPETFTVTGMTATLVLSDEGGEGGAERSVTTTSTLEGDLVFNRRDTCTDADRSCGYTYDETSGVELASALLLELGLKKRHQRRPQKGD